jgi:hypothetical protein
MTRASRLPVVFEWTFSPTVPSICQLALLKSEVCCACDVPHYAAALGSTFFVLCQWREDTGRWRYVAHSEAPGRSTQTLARIEKTIDAGVYMVVPVCLDNGGARRGGGTARFAPDGVSAATAIPLGLPAPRSSAAATAAAAAAAATGATVVGATMVIYASQVVLFKDDQPIDVKASQLRSVRG